MLLGTVTLVSQLEKTEDFHYSVCPAINECHCLLGFPAHELTRRGGKMKWLILCLEGLSSAFVSHPFQTPTFPFGLAHDSLSLSFSQNNSPTCLMTNTVTVTFSLSAFLIPSFIGFLCLASFI